MKKPKKKLGETKFTTKEVKSESNLKTPYANEKAPYGKKRADKKQKAYLKGKW